MKLEDDGSGDNKEEDIAIDEVQTDEESDDTQVSKSQTSRFANLQNIQFDFNPYDQDITILGAKNFWKIISCKYSNERFAWSQRLGL